MAVVGRLRRLQHRFRHEPQFHFEEIKILPVRRRTSLIACVALENGYIGYIVEYQQLKRLHNRLYKNYTGYIVDVQRFNVRKRFQS